MGRLRLLPFKPYTLEKRFYYTLTKTLMVFVINLAGVKFGYCQNPVANFTASTNSGCAALTVSFTDQSTGNPTAWNWEFSNGTLSNAQNPVVTFSNPGTYSVKLVVQNTNGIGEIERIDYITVFPSPSPNFSANLNLACVPATINFTDLSIPTGTIVSWEWDFGDGGTSTLQNPSHTYNNVGFYPITLSVTSNNGCKQTVSKANFIRVLSGINTDFTFSLNSSCLAPFTINFQNQSSGPGTINYSWDFGNGQTSNLANPSTIYNSAGTYTVQLSALSNLGCSGSTQKTVTITSTNTDFIAPTNICLNQPVTFQNNSSSPPLSSTWNFGDGTLSAQINPVKTFLVAGTYNIKLINHYSTCTDSITKTVTVYDKPLVDFTVDDSSSCQQPFTVQFTSLAPGSSTWQWDFGDGNTSNIQNPSHQYSNFGNYTVTLTISTSEGCTNTITKPAFVKIQPISILLNVPAGGCIPFTFTPQAIIQTLDTIQTYSWDLGEPGAVFNIKNPPPYTYTNAGSYNISLTVTSVSGCTKTVTIPGGVKTGVHPIVNFSASSLNPCASDTVTFTDLSTTTPGAEVIWSWDFGDGGGSSLQSPQHVFTDTGALIVKLEVSNNGCIDSTQQTIQVKPPVARFNYTVDCATKQVTFRDTSLVNPTLSPLTYFWEMGDPANTQFSVQNPPPFTYPSPGIYNVTLTVTNEFCTYQVTNPVNIADEPADFNINKSTVCKNETFTLSAINSDPANIVSYSWTIGGITLPGTGRSVSYSIASNGTYDVTLTITDINNCTTTKTITNYITVKGPTANFTVITPGGCLNSGVIFTDQSTPAATIVNWHFSFGDGSQQDFSGPPYAHTYSQLGSHAVSLTVTDNIGCTDTYRLPGNLLITNPKAGFKADTIYCPAVPLQFSDTSAGAGLTYQWTFGDGGTSTVQNPQHNYPLGQNDYSVKLVVTDISGCKDSVTKINYVKIRSPKAAFTIKDTTTICPPLRTYFTFQGSNYQSSYWDFGDGGTATAQDISHFYSTYGTFTPKLYVVGHGGCIDSASSSVTIHNPGNIKINYGPITTACNSLNVDFNLTVPPGFKFTFNFGDGKIDTSRNTTLSHFYSRPSLSQPSVTVYDTISGCQVTINGNPRINVLGAVPLFGMDRDEFCDLGPVAFKDFTTKNEPIISTTWDFDDGTTSNLQSPTHNFTQPGTYLVTLNITTQSNCSSSYTDTVFIYRTPTPNILSRDTFCVNISEPFNGNLAFPDTLTNWSWDFGNGQTSTQPNDNNITYTSTGNFTVKLTATNKIGCSNIATKTIYVTPPPSAVPVQDPITVIAGAGADLLMNYTGNITSYNWIPNSRLNCNTCAVPFANPQSTTTYTVQMEDAYGCKNSGDITVVVVCNNLNFFIPNTFSPNGDGQNDVFFPRGTGLFKIKSMTVFNRWGQIVFDQRDFAPNDPNVGWTGVFKGQKASADVYIYMIEIQCENNTIIPVKGNVTLLR